MNARGMILTLGLLVVTGIMTGNAQERVGIAEGRTVKRGFMGVTLKDLDQDLRDHFQIKDTGGALVTQAGKDSAAGKAGIQANDVIIRLDGQDVKDVQHLISLIAPTAPGTKVDVSLLRDGQEQTLPVILGERHEAAFATLKVDGPIIKFTTRVRNWSLDPGHCSTQGGKERRHRLGWLFVQGAWPDFGYGAIARRSLPELQHGGAVLVKKQPPPMVDKID